MRVRLPALYLYHPAPVFCPYRPRSNNVSGTVGLRPSARVLPSDVRVLADRAPTSMPAMSCMPNGPTGMPKSVSAPSISLARWPLLQQEVRLAQVVRQHPVGDETEAISDDDAGTLPMRLREFHRGRECCGPVSRPRTISSSLITFAGLKK